MSELPSLDRPLAQEEARATFGAMLDGELGDEAIATILMALSDRGETAAEIAGAAEAMRARLIPIEAPANAIDVCGTGGDGRHTLNVSTAVALVVAACGVPVAKHGNRAASSKAGAADTLEALGLDMEAAGRTAEMTLREIGICFLFAQNHHPAMGRIQPIRRKLGRRTIFNLMGPLANPARVSRQLVGIARPAYVPIYAEALSRLGTRSAMIVSGDEGLDELSLAGGNELARVTGSEVRMARVDASEAGLPLAPVEAIRGGDASHNAAALRALLMGEPGPYRDAVLFKRRRRAHGGGRGGKLARRGRGSERGDRPRASQGAARLLDRGRAMTDRLARICATKREEVAARKASATLDDLDRRARSSTPPARVSYGAGGKGAGRLRADRGNKESFAFQGTDPRGFSTRRTCVRLRARRCGLSLCADRPALLPGS